MAFGPMSVGSEGAFSLITDQTLTKENVAADAKAAGDALAKKFDKTGGTLSGPLKFPSIGKSATSRKIGWSGEEDGAEVYLQTDAAGRGTLIWNLLGAASGFALALNGAVKSWFGSDGSFHGSVVGKAQRERRTAPHVQPARRRQTRRPTRPMPRAQILPRTPPRQQMWAGTASRAGPVTPGQGVP